MLMMYIIFACLSYLVYLGELLLCVCGFPE